MKLLEKSLQHGRVALLVEAADDLWYLYSLLNKGDRCTGDSEYKYKLGGPEGKAQIVKRKVRVTISVERTEFSKHSGQLRIIGTVIAAPEEVPRGSHHTLDVSEGSRLTVEKDAWLAYQLEKLDEATASKSNALLLLFDREQALFVALSPGGHETLATIKGDVPKKGVDEGRQHSFYRDVVKHLGELVERLGIHTVIAGSPSFWKEYLERELTPELRAKTIFTAISSADETSVGELLRRPELQAALRQQRALREQELLERILTALAKDNLVYGMKDVQSALADGNLSELIVSERMIMKAREEESFDELEAMLKAASKIKAVVRLLSTEKPMQHIDGLGGVVGIKRW